jgi:hypothetical protein
MVFRGGGIAVSKLRDYGVHGFSANGPISMPPAFVMVLILFVPYLRSKIKRQRLSDKCPIRL